MRIVVLLALLGGTARADLRDYNWQRLQGGAWLHYELTGLTKLTDAPHGESIHDLVLAGAHLHGFVGLGSTVAYHIGIDLEAGSTIAGAGFAYDVAFFPLGIAVRFGETSFVTFGTGVQAMGAIGTLDDAVLLPLETNLEIGGGRVRFLGRARASWVAGAPDRHDGAPSIPFADELEAMAGVRVGHHYDDYGYPSGNGYFVGVAYREMLGATFLGLTLGYSIDLGTPRTRRQRHVHPV